LRVLRGIISAMITGLAWTVGVRLAPRLTQEPLHALLDVLPKIAGTALTTVVVGLVISSRRK
jgi:hypothetical protein